MTEERASANSKAMPTKRKNYHAFKLPGLFEAISNILLEASGDSWQDDVAIAMNIADVGADYAHNVVREQEETERMERASLTQSMAAAQDETAVLANAAL